MIYNQGMDEKPLSAGAIKRLEATHNRKVKGMLTMSEPLKSKARKPGRPQTSADLRRWADLRYQAFRKYGNRCQCCGLGPKDGVKLEVDHILPVSTHPWLAYKLNNLQILCQLCNAGKSNKYTDDWRWDR